MLRAAIGFFVLALIAAIFGFGGVASGAASIAKLMFYGFIVVAVITFVMSLISKR